MEWLLAYLILGTITGLLGGMFGIGGGAVLVPVLLMLFEAQNFPAEHSMHLALGSSMAIILFTAIASTRKHHQHGAVGWNIVRNITPGIFLGTALGALLAASISPFYLTLFFVLFLCFVAVQILLNARPHPARQLPDKKGITLAGVIIGGISTLVSIGGGTLSVPFLLWCNIPLRKAIATSAAIGLPIAVGGSLGYILAGWANARLPSPHLGYIYLPATLACAFSSVITAPLGAKLAHQTDTGLMRKFFAILLLLLAGKLLWRIAA